MKMLCIKDFENYAKEHLDLGSWNFFSQGVERDITVNANESSYTRYRLVPRILRNSESRDLSTTVLGEKVSFPVGIAPAAYQKMAHPEGELASATAAGKMGALYTLSSYSTTSLEEISSLPVKGPQWMQVYVLKDRDATKTMIQRAEASGYKALVLTVDAPVSGLRLKCRRHGFSLYPHLRLPCLGPVGDTKVTKKADSLTIVCDTLTWEDVSWIQGISKLPIILKGILTVEDALLAEQHGVSAVWVSNHGGRQLDGVDTAMDVLEDIARALAGTNCEVYADGGIRWGTDALKALALGARMVFIGRPMIWGLAHSGEDGVTKILEILRHELDEAMHLSGCRSISEIGPHLVKKAP